MVATFSYLFSQILLDNQQRSFNIKKSIQKCAWIRLFVTHFVELGVFVRLTFFILLDNQCVFVQNKRNKYEKGFE